MPRVSAFENVVAQIKSGSVAYSLFALARLFLEKATRHDVQLTAPSESPLFQLGENGAVSVDRQFLERSAFRFAQNDFYKVDVTETDRFQYRLEAIRQRLSERTKAIIVNSPANPTGSVLAPDRMAAIAALARERDIPIVSDEIYHGLTEGGRDHTILEFTDQAFVLNGFSKAFAMTGWRLGWVIVPHEHVRTLQTVYGNFFISTNEFVQWAGVAALRDAVDETTRFRRIFAERRRAMVDGLRAIGLGVGFEPQGAFYVLANARRFTRDSVAFAYDILDRAHVAVTPGAAFGSNAEGYLRFSYASSIERIREGLRRLGDFLAAR